MPLVALGAILIGCFVSYSSVLGCVGLRWVAILVLGCLWDALCCLGCYFDGLVSLGALRFVRFYFDRFYFVRFHQNLLGAILIVCCVGRYFEVAFDLLPWVLYRSLVFLWCLWLHWALFCLVSLGCARLRWVAIFVLGCLGMPYVALGAILIVCCLGCYFGALLPRGALGCFGCYFDILLSWVLFWGLVSFGYLRFGILAMLGAIFRLP